VATDRILEQKISDAGPTNQRVDPHLLTQVRHQLTQQGEISQIMQSNTPWYHLSASDPQKVNARLTELGQLHRQTLDHNFTLRVGQTLEIAIFRALCSQTALYHFGAFHDLNDHDRFSCTRLLRRLRWPRSKKPSSVDVPRSFRITRIFVQVLLLRCCACSYRPTNQLFNFQRSQSVWCHSSRDIQSALPCLRTNVSRQGKR
jgi:hypothetical protein